MPQPSRGLDRSRERGVVCAATLDLVRIPEEHRLAVSPVQFGKRKEVGEQLPAAILFAGL